MHVFDIPEKYSLFVALKWNNSGLLPLPKETEPSVFQRVFSFSINCHCRKNEWGYARSNLAGFSFFIGKKEAWESVLSLKNIFCTLKKKSGCLSKTCHLESLLTRRVCFLQVSWLEKWGGRTTLTSFYFEHFCTPIKCSIVKTCFMLPCSLVKPWNLLLNKNERL